MMNLRLFRRAAVAALFATPALAQNTPPAAPAPLRLAQPSDTSALQVDRIAAVVGDHPILWTEVMEEVNERRARGLKVPTDSAAQMEMARSVIQEMIDEEVIV